MAPKILFSVKYHKKNINIPFNDISISRNQEAEKFIQNQWKKARKQNPGLFSGSLVSVEKNNSSLEEINIDTIQTTYEDFFITKTLNFKNKFPDEICSKPLSVGCIIVTRDNYLVFGIRGKQLAIESGKTTVVSGMVDERDIIDKKIDLFGCIKREIKEETGISLSKITDLCCIGLVDNFEHNNLYVPFFGHVNVQFEEIIKQKNDEEFSKIIGIKNTKEMVQDMFESSDLADVAKPTLKIYLKLFDSLN